MSRHFETQDRTKINVAPVEAPAISLKTVSAQGVPVPKDLSGWTGPALPNADIVVVTWTDQEWNALDHVFLNSTQARTPQSTSWQSSWKQYSHGASGFASDSEGGPLWGRFQLVTINGSTVLLFKSNAHLAHLPWIGGLRAMTQDLLADTQAKLLVSIGTAGAGTVQQKLGDAVVTNAAYLEATLSENRRDPSNGKTFTSAFFPALGLEQGALGLMLKLSTIATSADLNTLFQQCFGSSSPGVKASDLIDGPLQNLVAPAVHDAKGTPLNTSDDYGMAPAGGSDLYCVYEEDDAVLAQVAQEASVRFSSIRNVSDTVIAGKTAQGKTIEASVRKKWAGALYDRYQFHTAVNGAIAAWAAVAGA
jgi:hypothetical protein